MFRQSFFIFALLFVSATSTVFPLKKIIRLAFGVSKSTYLPFEGRRYIQDGQIIGRTKPNLLPWYDPSKEEIVCSVGGWKGKSYEKDDTELLLFTHPEQKLAVIGFRGTESTNLVDWIKNFKMVPVEARIDSTTFKIHKGFSERYQDISSWFETEYLAIPRDYTIILTGHSLGGAMATISAVYASAKLNRRPDAVVTFASPFVGQQDFSDFYGEVVGCDRTLRIITKGDPVPNFSLYGGYTHVCSALEVNGDAGWLSSWNGARAHSLYYGYDRGLAKEFSNDSEINFGCDKLM